MSENEDKKVEAFRERELEEYRQRYLAANPPIDWADFLMTIPPGTSRGNIQSIYRLHGNPKYAQLQEPNIKLPCDSSICGGGGRIFECTGNNGTTAVEWSTGVAHCFLFYQCKHCEKSTKTYALRISSASMTANDTDKGKTTVGTGVCLKLGEYPPFGERTHPKVISLIGPDRDLFLNGRKSENHGLGIGASAYYRRVVENQKDRIFDQIIEAAKRLEADPKMISQMEAAKRDYRFDRAIDTMKMAIPESLKIKSHNPLTLLHGALSKDIHKKSDAECLELARSVRTVLAELAERISTALEEKKGIDEAVADLLKRGAED